MKYAHYLALICLAMTTIGCSFRQESRLSVAVVNRTAHLLYTDGLFVTGEDHRGRAASILGPKQRAYERYTNIRRLPDVVHLYFGSNHFPADVGVSHWVTLEKMANVVPLDADGTLMLTINPDYRVGVFYLSRADQISGKDIPDSVEAYPHQKTEHRLPPEPTTPVHQPENYWR